TSRQTRRFGRPRSRQPQKHSPTTISAGPPRTSATSSASSPSGRCEKRSTGPAAARRGGDMEITVGVNGVERAADVEPRLLLVHFLRETLGLTGTHIGCGTPGCGACTLLLDGVPVKSCTVLAVQASGRQLTTVEGLAQNGQLHPIQQGFKEEHGLQCGFCTPGMMLVSKALLHENPSPSEKQ